VYVRLARDLRAAILGGHPWIYRAALTGSLPDAPAEVEVRHGDELVARGFFDPDGPIAVRVLATGERAFDLPARVASACAIRTAAAHLIDSDAIRLIHGEADRLPGLVLDAYAGTGVVRFDGAAAEAHWAPKIPAIADACAASGFPLTRVWARPAEGRRGGGAALLGGAPDAGGPGGRPDPIVIRERAARFEVDVVHGQKTGFFLDQRTNRRIVGDLSAGLDVLNLFGYTGGFSVAAALGGARRVTTVDLAKPAIDAAARNLVRSGVDPEKHELVAADAFAFLGAARDAGRRWELVVCDPPSFAPSEKAVPGALGKYRQLAGLCAAVVAPGGLLATASCSSHVGQADFLDAIAKGIAPRRARLVDVRGAGPDHPVDPAFPEGRYLKFALYAM
jgi:23S rRNA (cytosine1962-C5)-methyltransferase